MHFGHQTRRWNPKMRRFIFGERDGIYIIDLLQTEALLEQRPRLRRRTSPAGAAPCCSSAPRSRPATRSRTIAEAADMPYVNHRWLGGLLTNFQTITQRIKRLHDLERYETEGQLQLLPTRERMAAQADLAKLRANLGGVKNMQRVPDAVFVIDLKTEAIAVARGPAPADPDHRPRRHQLRPRGDRLRDPRQRRRDPLVRGDHRRDRRRRRRGPRRLPRRGGGRAPRARAPRGRGAGPSRGRGAGSPRGGGAGSARGRGAGAPRGRGAGPAGRPAAQPRRPSRAARRTEPAGRAGSPHRGPGAAPAAPEPRRPA